MFDFHLLWSSSPLVEVMMTGFVIFMVGLIFADVLVVYGRNSFADYLLRGVAICGLLLFLAPLVVLAVIFFVKMTKDLGFDFKLVLAMLVIIAVCVLIVVLTVRGLVDFIKNLPCIMNPPYGELDPMQVLGRNARGYDHLQSRRDG